MRYEVVAWLTLAATLGYLCRNCIGVAEKTIRNDLLLTSEESGWFMGAFFWSYALLQVPAGIVGRRFGTRTVLAVCAVVWSAAIALLASSSVKSFWEPLSPFHVLLAAQLLMGAAQAGIFPCAVQSLRSWIPEQSRAFSTSFLAAGMQVGAILAAVLTGFLLERTRWEFVFAAYALPGLLWAAAFAFSFRNRPAEHPRVDDEERAWIDGPPEGPSADDAPAPEPAADARWSRILTSRAVGFLCAQQVFRAAGYSFFATWFPTFLQETRGVSTAESGYLQGLVFGATLLGGLTSGRLVDVIYSRTRNLRLSRAGVGTGSMLVCGALIGQAFFVRDAVGASALMAAGAFAAAFAGPCAYVTSIDVGGRNVPQVFGLMNMSGNLAAAATPVLVEKFVEASGSWNLVLVLFAVVYGLAAFCWSLVDPGRSVDDASPGA